MKKIVYYVSWFDFITGWTSVQMSSGETAERYCKKLNESGFNAIIERREHE